MKNVLFILIAVFFADSTFAQTTLTLQPDSTDGKDAYISSLSPTANRGSHRGIYSLAWTVSGNFTITRSFIQFDLSSIPIGSTIGSAELALYNDPGNNIVLTNGDHSNLTASNASFISRVTGPWDEFTVTWNNQPSYTILDQAVLAQSVLPNQDYTNIDVTAMIQYMVANPSQNFGFILRLETEINYAALIFGSSDNADAMNHPKLVINYTSPVGINTIGQNVEDLSIYPNPTNGLVTITADGLHWKNTSLSLYNTLGQLVLEEEVIARSNTEYTLDVSKLSTGVYHLVVLEDDKRYSAKVLVE